MDGVPAAAYDEACFSVDGRGRMSYEEDGRRARTGIDVSVHQGEIDWPAVAEDGVEFAMLRLGYRGYTEGGLFLDSQFERNIRGALDAGLEVGVYFFSQATSPEEALEEAEFVLSALEGYDLTYPVAFDWETVSSQDARTRGMGGEAITQCALAFCDRVREAGYEPAVYFNQHLGYLYYDLRALTEYPIWLAEYDGTPDFYYHFDLWQYTHTGEVDGIVGARGLGAPPLPVRFLSQVSGLQPGQQVVHDLLPVDLVEHLVAAAGVQLEGHVATAGGPEHPRHLFHAGPHGAHRVPVAGQEVDGGGPVHAGQIVPAGDEPQAGHHVPKHGDSGPEGAQGVAEIGVHRPLVPAEPVGGGAVGPEGPVIGPQRELIDQIADVLRPPQGTQAARQKPPQRHQGGGLLAGPGQDGPVQGARPADQIGPGEEGAHGVPQHHIGQAGVALPLEHPELADVPGHQVPPALGAK